MNKMTLVELQDILGEQLREIKEKNYVDSHEHKRQMERSAAISSIAKQMINNADIILRMDKLVGENKLSENSIIGIVR